MNIANPLSLASLIACLAACGGGSSASLSADIPITPTTTTTISPVATVTPTASATTLTPTPSATADVFKLTSSVGVEGGILPTDYTCDGTASSPALSWANAPIGTKEFALLMTTVPSPGTIKYNWVLSGIPANVTSLSRNTSGVGTAGVGSDGPTANYQAPCSQGPGVKTYTFTIYALSASPVLGVAANAVTGQSLSSAIASTTIGAAVLNLGAARLTTTPVVTATTVSAACGFVTNSLNASTTGLATATCDGTYAYIASNGLPTHAMMNGIIATNLQVPVAQNFFGANAWKIPLAPAIAAATTTAVDGPIGVAINGVPIFNPCKQGGCQNGDTKVLGELDICNGHAGRADDYHYHAAPTCLMAGKAASYWNTNPVGWALDGFAIFGYNNADGTPATRDGVCGGNTSAVTNGPAGYSYHVTDASPYVLSCFRGTPSPDLAGQGAKFSPIRQPPVTPFQVSGMTLTTDASDGYQVLQFTSARAFTSTATGSDNYANAAGTYNIRYKPVSGAALTALLTANPGKTTCWNFQFTASTGSAKQPSLSYCR